MTSSSGIYGGLSNLSPVEVTYDWRVRELTNLARTASELGLRAVFVEKLLDKASQLILDRDDSDLGTPIFPRPEEVPDAD